MIILCPKPPKSSEQQCQETDILSFYSQSQEFISCTLFFMLLPNMPLSGLSSKAGCFLIPSLTFAVLPILQGTSQMPNLVMKLFLVLKTEYNPFFFFFLHPRLLLQPWHHYTLFVTHVETSQLLCILVISFMYFKKMSFNEHLND